MPYDLCRHIKTNGKACNSPALHRSSFCYFHRKLRERHRTLITSLPTVPPEHTTATFEVVLDPNGYPIPQPLPTPSPTPAAALPEIDLPLLEDRESVQVAISLVVSAIARNRIDPRRAAAILYGLQLASNNAPHTTTEPSPASLAPAAVRGASGQDLLPRRFSTSTPRNPPPPEPAHQPIHTPSHPSS